MRFAPQFPNLPVSVPSNLYVKGKAKKIEKPKVLESPNLDQKQLIRSIAKLLPERIWVDPMVFPQRDGVLLALSQLSEIDVFVGGWLDSQFSCLPTSDNKLALYGKSNELLVEGHSGDLLHYAKQFCRKAIPAIVHTHRMGFVTHPILTGVLCDDLELFRKVRSVSKGLDRISKIEELKFIDQDNTINKFKLDGLQMHDTVVHLGAGTNLSSSQRALLLGYKKVVLVDPRCKAGQNSFSCTWQDYIKRIPAGSDIISDVAYGDENGMVLDGFKELVETLYAYSADRLVMVKMPLQLGYNARGVLHTKPRPHNLEVIVVLGEEGDNLDDLYYEMYPEVVLTNKMRNEMVMKMAFSPTVKQVYNTSEELYHLMIAPPPSLPRPKKLVRSPKKSRNRVLGDAGARKGVAARRHNDWYKYLRDADYDWQGPYVQLPPSILLDKGGLGRYDPGLPDVHVSLRSVRAAVVRNGYDVKYVNGCWRIV